ncbi:MAG: hypothetical protein WKF56_02580 [Candidatus Limnocylindrales bacterium]
MDRRTRSPLAVLLVAAIAVTGGAALILGGPAGRDPDPSVDLTAVVGVVQAIDSGGLADVRSFTLRTSDGRSLEFSLTNLAGGAGFPAGHLAEHQATSDPVRVWYRSNGGTLEAIRLEDPT